MVVKQLLPRKTPLKNPLIAIDLMGCAREPLAIAESVMTEFAKAEGSSFVFLVHESVNLPASFNSVKAPDLFTDKDLPLNAARRKNTSLTLGIKLLASGRASALVTAGDTGTLVAASRLFLTPLLSSRTTALMTKLPTLKGHVLMGDLGAYVNAKAEHFCDFARLGVSFLQAEGIKNPKMAMLNIGQESTKGPAEWVKAHQLLHKFAKEKGIDFIGNIEACDLFMEDLQFVVSDALAGNILLKTAEGIAKMIMKAMKGSHNTPEWIDWSGYPGAILAGLPSPVIKIHGYSTEKAFSSALSSLQNLLQRDVTTKMKVLLQQTC